MDLLSLVEICEKANPGDRIRISLFYYFEVQEDGTMKIKSYTPDEFLED